MEKNFDINVYGPIEGTNMLVEIQFRITPDNFYIRAPKTEDLPGSEETLDYTEKLVCDVEGNGIIHTYYRTHLQSSRVIFPIAGAKTKVKAGESNGGTLISRTVYAKNTDGNLICLNLQIRSRTITLALPAESNLSEESFWFMERAARRLGENGVFYSVANYKHGRCEYIGAITFNFK